MNKRLKRGDPGINPLDAACKRHDIAYSENSDTKSRMEADKNLENTAIKRVFSGDATIGERATAVGIAGAMRVKRSLSKAGLGLRGGVGGSIDKLTKKRKNKNKKKKTKKQKNRTKVKYVSFPSLVKGAKQAIKIFKPDNVESAIKAAVTSIKNNTKGKRIRKPRIIKLPTTHSGGILPLIPIFAGISALGSIVNSAAGIMNAIRQYQKDKTTTTADTNGSEEKSITIGTKSGNGFYLRPNKNGNGFYLSPKPKNP